MISNEYDAKYFLVSRDGEILFRVRVQRDLIAENLKLMSSSERAEEAIDDMIGQESEWAGYATVLEHFSSNHQWGCCERVEALKLLCNRAAQLERQACGAIL